MATGTSSRTSSPAFHTDDLEETTEYRSLSVLALLGLLFGLASPLCFGAPLLMAIPIAGAAISVLALQRIAASNGALAGRWAAIVGLFLCVAIGIAPFTREYVIRAYREQQAKDFSQEWLKLVVEGKTEDAFRLTIDATRGPAPAPPGEKATPTNPYDTFLGLPLVKAMKAAGPDAEIRCVGTLKYDPRSFHQVFVRQKFEIVPRASNSDSKPFDVFLVTQRARLPSEGRSRWLMWTMDDGTKPDPSEAAQ
jgi:hypothetical protein